MLRHATLVSILAIGLTTEVATTADPDGYETVALPFFKAYCLRCHDDKQQKGEFRLDTLARDFGTQQSAQKWAEVLFRINAGEMPPKKEAQPKAEELGKVAEWISARLKEGEAARMARRGPVAHYRLSREEYGHTVHDLLGVYFDVTVPGAFNDEPRWHGFDRIGSVLSLSPSHVERYYRAAETVLDRAYPAQQSKSEVVRRSADDGKWKEQGHPGPERWLLWPDSGRQAFSVKAAGRYRVRVRLSGLPSFKGRPPHLALWHHGLNRSVVGRDVLAPEDRPATVEIEAFLPEGAFTLRNESPGTFSDGHTLSNTQFAFRSVSNTRQKRPTGYQLFTAEGQTIYPTLMIDWVEVEGPIQFDDEKRKREELIPAKDDDLSAARDALTRFASRAWRRPASEPEVDRYMRLLQAEMKVGESSRSAYRTAMVAVLTSKNFYYLEEGEPTKRRETVTDWELASRLSYFLWSSMPDEELFAAARSGALTKPDGLRAQLARMLADKKIDRFTDSFPKQWLQLHRVGQFPPDPELYPDYDKWLEQSMVLETTMYFDAVFKGNLSLREFLVSDWTILNPRLAMHYGLPTLKETEFQRVKLRPEDHRGGLLTHASVLSLSSDGTRHRPVHRGVWVSEAIFARTPPPPPPNVEPLEPTPSNKPKATIRQQLEAHATHATCASCHRKIDPLGLAFDNYDAIGRWRVREQVQGGRGDDPLVNAAGAFPNGRAFDGPDEFKKLLAEDLDRCAEAFVEQLATYALRRAMTIDDVPQIRGVATASKKDGYKLRTLVEHFVTSDLFRRR